MMVKDGTTPPWVLAAVVLTDILDREAQLAAVDTLVVLAILVVLATQDLLE
jgi:hypothetical protein